MIISRQLFSEEQTRATLRSCWHEISQAFVDGQTLHLQVRKERRSDAANRRMWAMLRDISQQVDWHGKKLREEEWKDVFTAALKAQKVVPGIDSGFVVIGASTKVMTRAEMVSLQELMEAFGATHGVQFLSQKDK